MKHFSKKNNNLSNSWMTKDVGFFEAVVLQFWCGLQVPSPMSVFYNNQRIHICDLRQIFRIYCILVVEEIKNDQ